MSLLSKNSLISEIDEEEEEIPPLEKTYQKLHSGEFASPLTYPDFSSFTTSIHICIHLSAVSDLNNVVWPLIDQLTVEIHRNLCHSILNQITPPGEDVSKHVYKVPEEATVRKSRVFRKVPLYIDQKIGVHYVPIIVCTYEDMKIYLAHGDDKHVFRLDRDKDNIFYLNSGLHATNINV